MGQVGRTVSDMDNRMMLEGWNGTRIHQPYDIM
jgi:hypothetical protein